MMHYTEFEKAVKHVRDCLFWDFVDGVWNDVIVTPLDRNYFNKLMQQVSDAHAREVEALNADNAKLRELVRDMWPSYCYANSGCETFLTDEQDAAIRERVRRLKVINK